MLRIHRIGTMVAATAIAAMALGAAVASAGPLAKDSDDHYNPVSTVVAGAAGTNTFAAGGILVTCTHSTAGGKTPATGLKAFAIAPLPTFNDGASGAPCTDSFGFTDFTTTSGAWKLAFLDAAGDETQTEPNSGDRLEVIIPKAGAVVTVKNGISTVCTITVAPAASFKVIGTYNDVNTFTVAITNLPVSITGGIICPTATKASFNATYTFTPGFGDAS
jgi:hypothetical protein